MLCAGAVSGKSREEAGGMNSIGERNDAEMDYEKGYNDSKTVFGAQVSHLLKHCKCISFYSYPFLPLTVTKLLYS